jgi:hypothetical protein
LKVNGLHGVITQKIILFITTTVKTSNPTNRKLILHMEVIHSYKISVNFCPTTKLNNPEETTLQSHCCENLKSHVMSFIKLNTLPNPKCGITHPPTQLC